jgi:hypothetical protein
MTSQEVVFEELAERLTQKHTLVSQQQLRRWQRADRRDDQTDYVQQPHDNYDDRDYGRSR